MNCPSCGASLPKNVTSCASHLLLTKNYSDGHIHIHGDIEKKEQCRELIEAAVEEIGVSTLKNFNKKEVILHNRQRIGDMLMFTCAVRDFKLAYPQVKIGVVSTAMHIWDNNPYVEKSLCITPNEFDTLVGKDLIKEVGDRVLVRIGPSKLTNSSNRIDSHFSNAYRVSIEDALSLSIPQTLSRPDIWLTEEEYDSPRITEKPYWIICIGGEKGWGCKMYPFAKWQEFVNQNPDILFYQIGSKGDNHPRLVGDNVVDYIGKTENRDTGLRDLFKLFLNAEGSIGLVSFHMHLSGCLFKPCIVVAGAREPVHFTRYPGHQYLSTDGCLPCGINACWHCDIKACSSLIEGEEKVPKCVDMITPEDLTRALRSYYIGGRLKKGIPSPKPKAKKEKEVLKSLVPFVNVTPTPIKPKEEVLSPEEDPKKYGMEWGGGCITDKDWLFIRETIKKYNIKSALEFGAGLSTVLLNQLPITVETYETQQNWIDKILSYGQYKINLWDGKEELTLNKVDFSFVDGPAGGINRELSTKLASETSDYIIVHDAGREHERKWQEKYLQGKFDGPIKGGHRCHLWVRKQETSTTALATIPTGKTIKFVFNGRGEGGAETSSTWMMNKLVDMGHRVIYHTPNPQPCGTFRKFGDSRVEIRDCSTLNESCDVLVLYSNDWIWNFNRPEICDMFNNINAERKVLCVNYKMDRIGLVGWTKNWDEYLFLNSDFEKLLLSRCPNALTKVMAPPVDLTKYFENTPDYETTLKLIRHSSQGDSKYPKDFNNIVSKVLEVRLDVSIRLMPPPSFLNDFGDRVLTHSRNVPAVNEFLKLGNCFWYTLPLGYTEGGPKVVMEAQASGLPVIADNHSGMKDRVVPGTGWVCNNVEEQLKVIKSLTPQVLETAGKLAREHARVEYDPMNWIRHILGEKCAAPI